MIILVTDVFPTYDDYGIQNGEEFVASHGYNEHGQPIIIQNVHPRQLGAIFDSNYMEWVIYSPEEKKKS